MAQLHFNAEEVEPSSFTPLPVGKYQAVISASDIKTTSKGDGERLELEFTIIDGPYANRKVWTNLNRKNPNPVAVQIGREQLSSLCRAVGVLTITDSTDLHNRPLLIEVGCKPRSNGSGLQNEVKGFEPLSVASAMTPAPAATTTPIAPANPAASAPAPTTSATPGSVPWGRPAVA